MITNKILLSKPLDLRMKKQARSVEELDIQILNKDLFLKEMKELGYEEFGNFLIKNIHGQEINLTIKDDIITSIIAYDRDNNNIDIDYDVLDYVISDIDACNIE